MGLQEALTELEQLKTQVPLWIAARRFSKSVVDDEAADMLWAAPLDEEDSLVAIHHLAIHHHAKALSMVTEDSDELETAFGDAYRAWHRLLEQDAFWTNMVALGLSGSDRFRPETVDEIRQQMPDWLLGVNVQAIGNVVHEAGSSQKLAKRHMRVLLEAPFPEAVERARKRLVEMFGARSHGSKPSAIELERVGRQLHVYCEMDPHYLPGHLELLFVLGSAAEQAAFDHDLQILDSCVSRGRASRHFLSLALQRSGLVENDRRLANSAIANYLGAEAYLAYQRGSKEHAGALARAALEHDAVNMLANWVNQQVPRG